MQKRLIEQWEKNSEAYARLIGGEGTPHHKEILNPCVEQLLGTVVGKNLLDAGCGEGYLSRHYARKGAIVTAVDISERLIEIARNLTDGKLAIKYKIGNLCSLDNISDLDFDLILCNLVLLNLPCLESALQEFHRVLRSGGFLVFSVIHPSFNFYGPGTWEMGEKDPTTGRRKGLFFKVDNYFEEKEYQRFWKTREGKKFPEPITFYHRTISTYINSLLDAGFSIISIEEPQPKSNDQFFVRERRIPFFLVVKAKKD